MLGYAACQLGLLSDANVTHKVSASVSNDVSKGVRMYSQVEANYT